MERSPFCLSKRRMRGNLTALHKCSLSQKWWAPQRCFVFDQKWSGFLQGGRILNLCLSNKMIRILPSHSRKKASSTEEKQELSSIIHPVKFISRDWVLKTRVKITRQSSMRKLTLILSVLYVSCGKGEDMSPRLLICLFCKYCIISFNKDLK